MQISATPDVITTTSSAPVIVAESRSRLMLARALPELAIKLGRVYEFTLSDDEKKAALVGKPAISEVSYLSEKHQLLVDVTNEAKLSPRHTLQLPPGITILIGKSGAGKTKLALDRINRLNARTSYVRFGEPLDKYFVRMLDIEPAESRVELLQFEVDVAARMASFLFNDTEDVLIVDSLRYLFFASGGATGKGGVNMTLFTDLSFLDNVANLRGKSLVLVINPLTDDDQAYKTILEVATGSVSALIDVQSTTAMRFTSRYNDRDYQSISLPNDQLQHNSKQVLKAPAVTKTSLNEYTN